MSFARQVPVTRLDGCMASPGRQSLRSPDDQIDKFVVSSTLGQDQLDWATNSRVLTADDAVGAGRRLREEDGRDRQVKARPLELVGCTTAHSGVQSCTYGPRGTHS
ncbi:MAG TPA: hypothetical protein VG032_09400 [Acidimicrobiales bacterium]|nr:hypothetical protein [Acidimicrobiales bacterium]